VGGLPLSAPARTLELSPTRCNALIQSQGSGAAIFEDLI
jgi:hypothetical protein